MATTSSAASSVHITGLSGTPFDIEGLVQQLKAAEGISVTRMQARQTQLTNTRAAYKTLGDKLQSLEQTAAALNKTSLYDAKTVVSSNTAVLNGKAANGASSGTYDVTVVRHSTASRLYGATGITAGTLNLSAPLTSNGLATPVTGGTDPNAGELLINGSTAIAYNLADSLSTVISRINNSNAGVTAVYDQFTKGMVLTNTNGGASPISVSDNQGNLAQALKLTAADNPNLVAGQTAQITIDGLNGGNPIESSDDIFTDVETGITGLTLNLQNGTGSARINVSPDSTGASASLNNFISAYNNVLDYISQQSAVTGTGTSQQAGYFTGNVSVQSLSQQMRSILSSRVAGLTPGLDYLGGIGVGTTDQSGKLSFTDVSKLQIAIANNPGGVKALMTDLTKGVMTHFDSYVASQSGASSGLIYNREHDLDKQVASLQKSIDAKNNYLTLYEARLRASFVSMENAVKAAQDGIQQIQSSFGSNNNSNN